jgi:hypothetical protein
MSLWPSVGCTLRLDVEVSWVGSTSVRALSASDVGLFTLGAAVSGESAGGGADTV